MSKIQFENGQTVEFDGDPTPQDVEYVARSLNISNAPATPSIQLPKRTLPEKIGGFLGIEKFGKGIAGTIFTKSKTYKSLLRDLESGKITQQEFDNVTKDIMPSNKEVIGSAIQTAATIGTAGMGGSLAKTAGKRILETGLKSAGVGGVLGFGKGIEQEKSIGGALKEGAITGLASGVIGAGIGGVAELAKLATGAGVQESIVNRTLGIPKKVIERGKSPAGRILSEQGIYTKKGLLNKSVRIIDQTEKQIEKSLISNKTPVVSENVIGGIKNKLSEIYNLTLSPEEISQVVEKLPLYELRKNPTITMDVLNKVRKVIDNNYLGNAKWLNNTSSESITALKVAANTMREMVKQGNKETIPLFSRMADYITTRNSLNSNLAKPHTMTMLIEGAMSSLAGIASGGGITPEAAAKAATYFGLFKALTSTPAQIGIAKTLGGLGKIGVSSAIKIPGRIITQQSIKELAK